MVKPPQSAHIECIPLLTVVHYCLECNGFRGFWDGFCWVCDSFSPCGDPNDEDISQEEWDFNNPKEWIKEGWSM